jgi:hypothetical protein
MCKRRCDIHFTAHLLYTESENYISHLFPKEVFTHPSTQSADMIFQRQASSARASANQRDSPGASHCSPQSDSTNGDLEEPVATPPIAETSEQSDFLALLLDASIDSDSPLQKLHPHENLRTRDNQALGRLEHVDASSHDAYLCELRLRHFGARRQRVPKMQSSYFLAPSTHDDT